MIQDLVVAVIGIVVGLVILRLIINKIKQINAPQITCAEGCEGCSLHTKRGQQAPCASKKNDKPFANSK